MPDPKPHPNAPQARRVALHALIAGTFIMGLKFGLFYLTNSAAVLSDALESIINLVAATMMLYAIWFANRPADRDHPYGHGKIEFMAVGIEGVMIFAAGLIVAFEGVSRLIHPPQTITLDWRIWLLAVVALLSAALAGYVLLSGRRYQSPTLLADGKHLLTDVASTLGVFLGLLIVRHTGKMWLDPVLALIMGALILFTSWRLLGQSIDGLMDRADPREEKEIARILDEEVAAGSIRGYHKVRHRHNGTFHWVDLHVEMDPEMKVREAHDVASRIEGRIERLLGEADATAHMEPYDPTKPQPGPDEPGATSHHQR